MFKDVGILGTGLWNGPVITNAMLGPVAAARHIVDPVGGKEGAHVAGFPLAAERYPRAAAAVRRSHADPYRGVQRRRLLPRDARIADAEVEAGRHALADAGLAPADVDVLLVHSLLPEQVRPGDAALVARGLGIHRAAVWDVDAMCASALAQMTVGAALITSGQARHVLCVQSTACSKVIPPGSPTAVFMGDMASAFVLGPRAGSWLTSDWCAQGEFHPMVQLRRPTAPYWTACEEPIEIGWKHDFVGSYLQAVAKSAGLCQEGLRRAQMRLDDVGLAITHQSTYWYPAFIEDCLGLPEGIMFHTFEEYGNINACAVATCLHEARRAGRCGPGTDVLFFVPAAGLVCGALLLHY